MSEYYYEEEENPETCPKCDDLEILRTDIHVYGDQIVIEWMCGECDFRWVEYYDYDFRRWKKKEE